MRRLGPEGHVKEVHDHEGILIHRERVITDADWDEYGRKMIVKFYETTMPDERIILEDVAKYTDIQFFKRITGANIKFVVQFLTQYEASNVIMHEYRDWLLDKAIARANRKPMSLGNAPEAVLKWRKNKETNQWESYFKPTVWKNCMNSLYSKSLNLERSPRTGEPDEWYTDQKSQSPKTAGEMLDVDWNKYRKINHFHAGDLVSHWDEIDITFNEHGSSAMPVKYLRSDLDYWERSESFAEQNINQLTTRQEWNAWIDGKEVDLFQKVQDALAEGKQLDEVLTEYEQYCLEEELFQREGRVDVAVQDIDRPYQHENIYASEVRPAFRKYSQRQLLEIELEQLQREPLASYAGGMVADTGFEVQPMPF